MTRLELVVGHVVVGALIAVILRALEADRSQEFEDFVRSVRSC